MNKIIFILLILFTSPVFAATYYVDNSASDDTGDGSIGDPKKYIPSGISLMSSSGGDTLIINDGTYSGASNNITSLTSGQSGSWNIIQAETDGGVIITSTFSPATGNYVEFHGFKFKISESKTIAASYLKFFRCAFEGGQVCSSSCSGAVNTAVGSYQLYEDCWFYGVGGRYTLMIYEESNTVFRRCVIRHDGGYTNDGQNPEAVINNYSSSNVSWQNVIVIDNDQVYSTYYTTDIYFTGHGGEPNSYNVEYLGCIDINGQNVSFYNDGTNAMNGITFKDFISYGNENGIEMSGGGTAISIDGLTLGAITTEGIGVGAGSITLINSVLWDHTTVTGGSATYTDTYNPSSYSGTGVIHVDPEASGLLYLPRIEGSSTLSTAGSGGGQAGATVLKKIGTSGTLYGEAGYNTVTSDDLWPWPNEDRIKTDFASVSGIGARGFAASGTQLDGSTPITLTSYIWEYLNNQMPSDIYGADTTAPTLSETTPVPTPSTDTTPTVVINTDEAGTLSCGGDCSCSGSVTVGNNNVDLGTLSVGVHSNCTVTVTDASENASEALSLTSFEITAPETHSIISLGGNGSMTIGGNGSITLY